MYTKFDMETFSQPQLTKFYKANKSMKTVSLNVANHLLFVNFFKQSLTSFIQQLVSQVKKTAFREMVTLVQVAAS